MAELPADFRDSETAVTSLEALGRAIRAKRKASGLRIDDAAALCGVSVDLLSRLENGKSGVSTDRVLRVLDGLGLVLLVVDKELTARIAASTPQGNS
jgi:transcriptional regulator with XRE-family HTH domain